MDGKLLTLSFMLFLGLLAFPVGKAVTLPVQASDIAKLVTDDGQTYHILLVAYDYDPHEAGDLKGISTNDTNYVIFPLTFAYGYNPNQAGDMK